MRMENEIHPSVIITGDVKMGKKNKILPFTFLVGPLTIGDNNIIGPNVVIGSPGADTKNPRYNCDHRVIVIGSNNIIREFGSVQKSCYTDLTDIKNDIFLMRGVDVAHDVILESKVVAAANASIAGIAKVLEGANLAMSCSVSQRCVVGPYSIVAQGAAMTKNVKPFSRYIPGKKISVNKYAIDKFNFSKYESEINEYVLHNIQPKSEVVLNLIEKFNKFHMESKKELYK